MSQGLGLSVTATPSQGVAVSGRHMRFKKRSSAVLALAQRHVSLQTHEKVVPAGCPRSFQGPRHSTMTFSCPDVACQLMSKKLPLECQSGLEHILTQAMGQALGQGQTCHLGVIALCPQVCHRSHTCECTPSLALGTS